MSDLYKLNSQSFAAQLHTSFKVQNGEGPPITLELAEVKEPPAPPRVEVFCLTFRGPVAPRLKQQIHRFEHDTMGAMDLFLTVIGADGEGTSYEVVFNRLQPAKP